MAFLDENGVAQLWAAVKDRLAGAFDSVEFDMAEQAANLMSGDSIATAFGKLAKNYSSLLTIISDLNTSLGNRISEVNTNLTSQINTKLNKSDVLANYTTTATGKALDASLGPAIKTKMDLADTLNTNVSTLQTDMNNLLGWQLRACIGMRYVDVPCTQASNGMDLASYIVPNPGYKFLFWMPYVVTSGFVTSKPVYIANPAYPAGGMYCADLITTGNGSYRPIYIQIRETWK